MQRIPDTPPLIAPVSEGTPRTLWSVMIPTYNCSEYLTEAIESVLIQDPGTGIMQIEVVDDCSNDANVEALVKQIGKGRVLYYRHEQNVGSLRNFETCINRAKGYYIHLLHGDDRVKEGYYSAITNLFNQFPEAGAAYSAWDYIDSDGAFSHHSRIEANEICILDNWLYKLAEHQRLQYVAITVKREVYENLGSFYGAVYGEDWEMWARIAKEFPTAYTPNYLAEYREHKNSISGQSYLSGQNVKDMVKISSIITTYLPKKDQKKMNRLARKNYIYWALNIARHSWYQDKINKVAYNQIKTILSVYVDTYILTHITIFLLRIVSYPVRKRFNMKH